VPRFTASVSSAFAARNTSAFASTRDNSRSGPPRPRRPIVCRSASVRACSSSWPMLNSSAPRGGSTTDRTLPPARAVHQRRPQFQGALKCDRSLGDRTSRPSSNHARVGGTCSTSARSSLGRSRHWTTNLGTVATQCNAFPVESTIRARDSGPARPGRRGGPDVVDGNGSALALGDARLCPREAHQGARGGDGGGRRGPVGGRHPRLVGRYRCAGDPWPRARRSSKRTRSRTSHRPAKQALKRSPRSGCKTARSSRARKTSSSPRRSRNIEAGEEQHSPAPARLRRRARSLIPARRR